MAVIQAGYRITAKSWENDYDYVQTRVHTTTNKWEARMLVKLGKVLRKERECQGLYDPSEAERCKALLLLESVLREEPEFWKVLEGVGSLEEYETLPELDRSYLVFSYLRDTLLGYSEYYPLRTLESLRVEYVPGDIILKDVTDEL